MEVLGIAHITSEGGAEYLRIYKQLGFSTLLHARNTIPESVKLILENSKAKEVELTLLSGNDKVSPYIEILTYYPVNKIAQKKSFDLSCALIPTIHVSPDVYLRCKNKHKKLIKVLIKEKRANKELTLLFIKNKAMCFLVKGKGKIGIEEINIFSPKARSWEILLKSMFHLKKTYAGKAAFVTSNKKYSHKFFYGKIDYDAYLCGNPVVGKRCLLKIWKIDNSILSLPHSGRLDAGGFASIAFIVKDINRAHKELSDSGVAISNTGIMELNYSVSERCRRTRYVFHKMPDGLFVEFLELG